MELLNIEFNTELLLTLVASVCTIVAAFIGYYLYIKRVIESQVPDAINGAEDTGKPGAEKFEEAVDTIYALIPLVVKPFITRTLVETLVQEVFDKMEAYAKKQVNNEQKTETEA